MHKTISTSRSVLHSISAQICVIVAIVAVLWLSIGAHLLEARDETTTHAIKDASNLTYAAEQSIDGMISSIDQTLMFIRTARSLDPNHFNVAKWMDDAGSPRGDFKVAMIDRDGMLQANQHNAIQAPIDLSDRSHFRAQRDNPASDTLFISEPILLRSTGRWSVQFSRRLSAADGSFDGTVVLSLDPVWLTRLYDTLEIGHGRLMVIGIDGIVRAVAPFPGAGLGQNVGPAQQHPNDTALAAEHGSFRLVSRLDGVDRFISFRRLPDYPLVVSVGLNAQEVFAPYYRERLVYTIAGAWLTILILVGGIQLSRQNRRLQRSRQVLHAAVENISQGLMMIDENGQLPVLNSRAIELLGLPPELLARKPSFAELVRWQLDDGEYSSETELERQILVRAEPGRFDFRNSRYERTRPDGRQLEVRTQLLATGGATRTFTDITERRMIEQQLAQSQKMEAIGILTGGIAHDFNNGLGIVIGNLDLLERLVRTHPTAAELCAEAREGALRCADLIRRLLAFARRQPLHPRQTDVNVLIDNITKLISRTLGERITITLRLDDALWPVLADPGQLEAALVNLAANASDAMPHGGGLTILTRPVHLDGSCTLEASEVNAGDFALIEISDTGTGISPEVIGHIFEPFFTTKAPGKGTGLGLSMTFGFVKQSGGHLTVFSEPGVGTTFRLYLPRSHIGTATEVGPVAQQPVNGGDETILVVEDNIQLRLVAERQLTRLGYRVHGAENATVALEILTSDEGVDLLFTDIVMPGTMDGLDLADLAARLRPRLKIVLTSGFPGVQGADQRLAVCPFHLLTKPYRLDKLARLVRETLDGAGTGEAAAGTGPEPPRRPALPVE
jgi:signal transduction histidine kinase/ActR/RegA family two-component response regulator